MLFLEWKNQKTLFLALNYIIMSPAKHPNTWGSPWWSVTPSSFSEDRSIDSFVPMTYLFFLSISRIWNWLGDPDFQKDTQCHQTYFYALHIFSVFELNQHKDWMKMLFQVLLRIFPQQWTEWGILMPAPPML